jgi:bifunctional DNA-binding transcriptional regulator/antitoxin component of YhaV-PrlF toxin-antitoxin module
MAIRVKPAAISAQRWAANIERAAYEAVLAGTTHKEIARGLACIPGGAYTLTKRGGTAFSLTLPRALCELIGAKVGDRFVYEVTERGTVELRRVGLEDLPELVRTAAARADEILAAQHPRPLLKHFEKLCERCSQLYCARRSSQRFCPACGLLRARASDRRYWHRQGKLSPSYQRKLKGRRSAGAELSNSPAAERTDTIAQGALVFG